MLQETQPHRALIQGPPPPEHPPDDDDVVTGIPFDEYASQWQAMAMQQQSMVRHSHLSTMRRTCTTCIRAHKHSHMHTLGRNAFAHPHS